MAYWNRNLGRDAFYRSYESSRELLERLCDLFEVPQSQRERNYVEALRLLNEHRPLSLISSGTGSNSQVSSARSFQLSTTSSRTSYMSSPLEQEIKTPQPAPAFQQSSPRSFTMGEKKSPFDTRQIQDPSVQIGTSTSAAVPPCTDTNCSMLGIEKTAKTVRRARWCPWCAETFTRPNDLKKHVQNHCCARKFWVCKNPACGHVASKEKRAKQHCDQSGDAMCMINSWTKIERQCERRHFGCEYCAEYFSELEGFLDHFGQTCRPDRLAGKKSSQRYRVIALLQQPELRACVESLCVKYHGNKEAYKSLYWCWQKATMARMIEQLEYGPKAVVDRQNPGIVARELDIFLVPLIQLSSKTKYYTDLRQDLEQDFGPSNPRQLVSLSKPLPPIPEANLQSIDLLSNDAHDEPNRLTHHAFSSETTFPTIVEDSLNIGHAINPSYYTGYSFDGHLPATNANVSNPISAVESGLAQDFDHLGDCELLKDSWRPMEVDSFVNDRHFTQAPTVWD